MENFDVAVIGGGPGGYPAAIRAAQLGAKVALIEKEFLGGTCLNWGCIPTKTLLASSSLFARMKQASSFGLAAENVRCDYAAMARRKDEVVTRLRGGIASLLKAHGVTFIQGTASLAGRERIAVQSADRTQEVSARAIIIATGSTSAMPSFLPRHERVMESRRFLELTSLPQNLIIMGGGVIGCEFACLAAQLGANVTVVEMLDDILMTLDADVRRELRRHMEKSLNVRFLTGKPLEDVKADDRGVSGRFGEQTVQGDVLLVAVGRKPAASELNLASAGLAANKSGFIETDSFCRTKAANIYAVGDVTGKAQLAHAATSQGLTAAENAVRPGKVREETLVPACIFTSPEVASAGLTEQQAKEQGLQVVAGRYSFSVLGKAMAIGETEGFVKWVARSDNDQLVGAQAVGPHATELIAEAAVAIRAELTAAELARTIHAHPTLAEMWMEAAHAVHGTCLHAPPPRRRQQSA